MTRNPYAHPIDEPAEQLVEAAPRVSIMALLSIVLSVICCIPGLGLLGSIFGGASLVAIGRSGGRLKGRGMAITGLVLGLFVTIVWLAGFGIWRSFAIGLSSASTTMSAIEAGDWDAARSRIVPADGSSVTDEQLASFRTRYQAAAGSFKSMPTGIIELMKSFAALGSSVQQYQGPGGPLSGKNGVIPAVATFDKGQFIVAAEINRTASKGGIRFQDLVVALPDGTKIRLFLPPPPPAPPAAPPAPPGGGP